jgi:vacuolar-type H+-ATPase catalytic subunit A/Vma1
MKIEVKNDNKIVFVGDADEFLKINECDPDIEEMILEVKQDGYSRQLFFSGTWEIKRQKEEFDPLYYCKGVLLNNRFLDFEIPYYQGLTGKNPHGINDSIWQQAAKEVDFINRLTKSMDGYYYITE